MELTGWYPCTGPQPVRAGWYEVKRYAGPPTEMMYYNGRHWMLNTVPPEEDIYAREWRGCTEEQ